MTMNEPCPGVVRFEGNDDISTSGQKDNVSPGRIDEIESLVAVDRIERGIVLSQQNYIHPMPMKRMGDLDREDYQYKYSQMILGLN